MFWSHSHPLHILYNVKCLHIRSTKWGRTGIHHRHFFRGAGNTPQLIQWVYHHPIKLDLRKSSRQSDVFTYQLFITYQSSCVLLKYLKSCWITFETRPFFLRKSNSETPTRFSHKKRLLRWVFPLKPWIFSPVIFHTFDYRIPLIHNPTESH